jgi:hypothetical protein
VFSQEKRPLHMMKQKHKYGQLMPVSQGWIFLWWCGSIMPFTCQDWASHIKISQITYFSCIFPGKRPLHMVKQKHRYGQLMNLIQFFI